VVAAAVAAPTGSAHLDAMTTQSVHNPIPPRLQWDENNGYCGEVALVSAGLYYGQYLSQYDARQIAGDGKPQYKASAQLLLGVNDAYAATQMRLTYAEWTPGKTSTASDFLAWVKGEVIKGYPVAIGVYTNEYLFYEDTDPDAGDPDYDHIVVVTGVASQHPLSPTYYANDVLTFSDNGLWTGTASGQPQYAFSYEFAAIQATRQQANARSGNIYSLADAVRDYGIAITGIADPNHETLPVRVATSVDYETPQIVDGSNTRPAPMPLALTVTVSGLHAGAKYNLYRYSSVASVPTSAFNGHRSAAADEWSFTATGATYTLEQAVVSDEEVIYRAVPAAGA
jgi:hypothetical protein